MGYGIKQVNRDSPIDKYSKYIAQSIEANFDNRPILGANTETAKSIPVLTYHGVVETIKGNEDVLYDTFKDQMFALKENGYQTIKLEDFKAYLNGEKELPDKSFLLTFDDGRKDSYYPVDPILKALNFNAVNFIIAGSIRDNDPYHLTLAEIQQMLETGRWEIGSHGFNAHQNIPINSNGELGHWLTSRMWLASENRLENENEYLNRTQGDFLNSKNELINKFGVKIFSYAYPYGDYAQQTVENNVVLEKASSVYDMTFYQSWNELQSYNYPRIDTKLIRRIPISSEIDSSELMRILVIGRDKDVDHQDDFSENSGWTTNWGENIISDGRLQIKSKDGASGGSTYLMGSNNWSEYQMSVDVKVNDDTSTFSIIFNLDRFGNYSYCNYGVNGVSYNYRHGDEVIQGKYWNHYWESTFPNTFRAGVMIKDGLVSCMVNSNTLVRDDLIGKATDGIIGFTIWNSGSKNPYAEIDNFSAKPI